MRIGLRSGLPERGFTVAKFSALKTARGLKNFVRPVELTNIDGDYHTFIVRYSGDYITHTHDKDEFIYIMEGALVVEMDGGEEEVRQGEALLIPAGTAHRPRCKNFALGLVLEARGNQKQMDPQV
jgi:mannose-6-phosphate isomerase-like protein (cupin superfamily)